MKLSRKIKIFNVFFTTLFLFVVVTAIAKPKAGAVSEPAPQTPEQCIGEALAEYMNAMTAAKESGQIPSNIKLLSPAFNMTSYTFPGIVAGMRESGADFSKLDGISGNVYNVGGQPISYYMQTVRATFPGANFIITETGTFDHSDDGIINLAEELQKLEEAGDIDGALLFNGLGTNGGWNQHRFTPDQIKTLCGGDCAGKKIGINTAVMFGFPSDSYYQEANSLGMSHSLEIADSGQINNTIKGIQNSINNGIKPIIRIGIGSSSGGFKDPATYAAFLSQIGNQFPGVEIYAIAGPNEPDLENWLAPECSSVFIPAGEQCVGPVSVDKTFYRGQVIGHQDPSPDNLGPWKIYASAVDEKENSSDIVSSVIAKEMTIAPTVFWSTDFSTMAQKYIGSLTPTNEDFANSKAESQFKLDSFIPRSPPLYMVSHIPGKVHTGGLQISPQPEQGEAEMPNAFQARTYPSQDGTKPGQKSTIDNLGSTGPAFIACIQASVCDPSTGESCLKNDKSGNPCGPDDPPESCVGLGELVKFTVPPEVEMELLEPVDRQPMDKVLWDFSTALVRKPNDPIPPQRGAILANSLEEYYAKEQEFLAKNNENTQSFIADVVPKNLPEGSNEEIGSSYSLENINPLNPKPAKAAGDPPYEENQPYCQGAHILIENKMAENQFSVKVWKSNPECPQPVDWGYYVEYWVGNEESGYQQVSTCGNPNGGNIHKTAGLPIYNADGTDQEKYGVPIETLPGCSIPVTPSDLAEQNMSLKVHFQITNSSAPYSDNPNCTQRPVCTCPNEEACGIVDNQPPPPRDCSKCETWAPAGECATMEAENLLEMTDSTECDQGYCKTTNRAFRLAGSIKEDDKSVDVQDVGGFIDSFFNYLMGVYADASKLLFNYNCEKETEEGACTRYDANGCAEREDDEESWSCVFGERQYLMYGYVPSRFEGKLNQFRSGGDFQVFQALYKIPGITESYFEQKPSKHALSFKLSMNGIDSDKDAFCPDNALDKAMQKWGLTGPAGTCIDLQIGGSDTRTMYIEYIDHYSQAAQYCLSEASGSLPGSFPTRAMNLCEPFLSSLRGGGFLSGARGATPLSGNTVETINRKSLEVGVPARLLTTILEIEGGGNLNSCTRNSSTATGPFQITDLTLRDVVNDEERTQWKLVEWAPGTPQSQYREAGRCDPEIAPTLAARVLKLKAGVDVRTGTIGESEFEKLKATFRGYYGSCAPDTFTEGRWGPGIGYCDYGLWRMGLTQYCTNAQGAPSGELSPTCDNEGGPVVMDIKPEELVRKTIFEPVDLPEDPNVIQAQLAADLENILNKYSINNSFDLNTPIDQMPKGFKEELENLKRVYQQKYSL